LQRVGAVAEHYLGQVMESREAALTGSLTAQQLRALAGTYRNPSTAEMLRVTSDDTKLLVELEGFPAELRALSSTEFEPADYAFEIRLKFEPAVGKSATLTLILSRKMELTAIFEVIPQEAKPSVADLTAYAGDYWSEELRVTYRLVVKDGKLWLKALIGADGIIHATVPFDELRPLLPDEFDLKGAPIVFDFQRNGKRAITGFKMNAFQVRRVCSSQRQIESFLMEDYRSWCVDSVKADMLHRHSGRMVGITGHIFNLFLKEVFLRSVILFQSDCFS
jgi:hypothetical protein